MQSISKTVVSEDDARAVVAAVFGPRAELRAFAELTEGFFNAAYQLDLADGARYVLKVAPPAAVRVLRYERAIMHAEVEVMRLVGARTTVPVPRIHGFDSSCRLLASPFFIMEFVAGVPLHKLRPQLAPDEQAAIDRAIGGYLRQMNDLAGPAFGYIAPGAPRYPRWDAAFTAMFDAVLADGRAIGVELPLGADELRRRVERLAWSLAEVREPRLVHWDLWDGNIFVDPDTRQISGLIDFERALWGDPLMEFQFRRFAVDAAFAEGYGRALLADRASHCRRVLYNLYLYLIMIVECFYREYPTRDQELWARQQLAQELEAMSDE